MPAIVALVFADSMQGADDKAKDELPRPIDRELVAGHGRGRQRELVAQAAPQRLREVGHQIKVCDAALENPPVELAGVKPRDASGLQLLFELAQLESGQIRLRGHGYVSLFVTDASS